MNSLNNTDKTNPSFVARRFLQVLEHPLAAWAILCASLVTTLVAWQVSNAVIAQRMHDRFESRVKNVTSQIEKRMLEYEQVLRGGVGLFHACEHVSRQEWRTYVEHCSLERYFPGIQGIGVVVTVKPSEKEQHEAQIRAEGFDDYKIYPEGERERYSAIIYLEPFTWRNQRAFGYDMFTDPNRRRAMDLAIETGEPTISGMVTLVQETDDDVQNGFVYYMPMYSGNSRARNNQQRKDEFRGFISAAFRVNDLMAGILGEKNDDVKFAIYDSPGIENDRLLYDSENDSPSSQPAGNADFTADVNLNLSGREWTLYFESRSGLVESADYTQSVVVAFGGLTIDILLFLVIAAIGRQKMKAIALAKAMTKGLTASEELNRTILANASEAVVTVDEEGLIEIANEAAQSMLGITSSHSSSFRFETFLACQTWASLKDKLRTGNDANYTCTVRAIRSCKQAFSCRLTIGSAIANDRTYHIIVAKDETDRLESERKMAEINEELVSASRSAGMTEVANGVLHNVGNILNSVNVSASVIRRRFERSALSNLEKACGLIAEHESDFAEFVTSDDRGRKIPGYILKIANALKSEHNQIGDEIQDLLKNVNHIKDVISAQQVMAKSSGLTQMLSASGLIDDSIIANKAILTNHDIEVGREIEGGLPEFVADRHKILQILVNLIKNAKDALVENATTEPKITVRVSSSEDNISFEVIDNGVGIPNDKLDKIFQHGFTTKETGHGFGLHSSANAATELGGALTVSSPGKGQGAAFQLLLPLNSAVLQEQNSTSGVENQAIEVTK